MDIGAFQIGTAPSCQGAAMLMMAHITLLSHLHMMTGV